MSVAEDDHHNASRGIAIPDSFGVIPTSVEARAKRRIAALEEELQVMKHERGTKQRFVTDLAHYMLLTRRSSQKDHVLHFSRPSGPAHGCPLC
jgi:hypothetical protein